MAWAPLVAARKAPEVHVAAVGMPVVAGPLEVHRLLEQGSVVLLEAQLREKTNSQSVVCLLSNAHRQFLKPFSIDYTGTEPPFIKQ